MLGGGGGGVKIGEKSAIQGPSPIIIQDLSIARFLDYSWIHEERKVQRKRRRLRYETTLSLSLPTVA